MVETVGRIQQLCCLLPSLLCAVNYFLSLTCALLLPFTKIHIVQDRPAGGTPSEVADANPGLAAAVPATVGQSGPTPSNTATEVAEHNLPAGTGSADAAGKASGGAGAGAAGKEGGVGGSAVLGAGEPAVAGAGMRMGDGSGMEVPELAVLPSDT